MKLDPTTPLTVGRDRACALSIQSDDVSRRHARIEANDGSWRIVDEGSTNGIFVNDERVKSARLGPGDRIYVGDTVLDVGGGDGPPVIVETEYRATPFDGLTGLYNRRHLLARLDAALATDQRPLAVLWLDVDGMRAVNDEHGHPAGDQLLILLATRLRALVDEGALVARYGGDELVVVAPDRDVTAAAAWGASLCAQLGEHALDVGGRSISAHVSVGVAEAGADTRSAKELLRMAEDDLLANRQER